MDALKAKLDTELQLLQLTQDKTKVIIAKGNHEKIRRHKETLKAILRSVEDAKVQTEKAKLAEGTAIDDVLEWVTEIEVKIDQGDVEITNLERFLEEVATKAENEKRNKERILRDQEREEELNFQKLMLDQQATVEMAKQNATSTKASPANNSAHVKMPKLIITKYNGTYERWLSFWNKFQVEIDSTNLPAVTKFSYLKELLETQVCDEIDGLPFNDEGYERAKKILKTNHGNESEIVRAYVKNIQELPTVKGSLPSKIHEFYKTLSYNVQSLETLGKLSQSLSLVRGVLDKLPGIKAELVSNKAGWQDWGFEELIEALKNWSAIHPVESSSTKNEEKPPRDKSFFSRGDALSTRECVYCEEKDHKSFECKKVASPAERKQKLQAKKLCFNCTGTKHQAAQCRSRATCFHCKRKHHSSICEDVGQSSAPPPQHKAWTTTHEGERVCHPIVLVKVNGIVCRALLDTGATASYASGFLLDLLKLVPTCITTRQIQTVTGIITKEIEIFDVQVCDLKESFTIPVNVTKVDRGELLSVENPRYQEMIASHPHLKGVYMEDTDIKDQLPVHLILGASEYCKIKTRKPQRTGVAGEPVAELTRFGWTMISAGKKVSLEQMFLAQTAIGDYEQLCRMDVLGLADTPCGDQGVVHTEFLEGLRQDPEGWYETGLPWKGDHPPLPSNEAGSLKRLRTLVHRLKKTEILDEYDMIIQDQLQQGIIEEAEKPATGKEFYIPHRPVVRETAETTKTRIVYDASAKSNDADPSLNDCLEIGPPLQNKLWEVLVRGRFYPIALAGDLRQAFLQVRIRPEDRDVLRFHWLHQKNPQLVRTLRFTRALFGLAPSPFLLGGVIRHHLNSCRDQHPDVVKDIECELYVDDLLTGGVNVPQVKEKKRIATEIFQQASFHLHKWHSNENCLEQVEMSEGRGDLSFAKQQLGVKPKDCRLLGLKWDKEADTIEVTISTDKAPPTKRGILGKIARIYDPLGLVAPTTLQGKLLYREACEEKCKWDAPLSPGLISRWQKWEMDLPRGVVASRSLAREQEPFQSIALHAFGDASGKGVAAAVYAVISQPSKTCQGLVTAKARLAKQGLTIPRKELVSGHMAVNLLSNTRNALQGFNVTSLHCWLDSTVALHWIRGQGQYKQFVSNRILKIQEHVDVTWRHVPSKCNPADLASRGGPVNKEDQLWWSGPEWLCNPKEWPPDIVTKASEESNVEARALEKSLFAAAVEVEDELDALLHNSNYWQALRVSAWLSRFVHNARSIKANRTQGPLTTEEIERQERFFVLRALKQEIPNLEKDRLQLNLQRNAQGLLECRGRIQGLYPIYIPDSSTLAERFVMHAHKATLHGGVGLTMTKVRERHWIPRLRRLVKRVVKKCHGCKRYQAIAYSTPPPGALPTTRTEGTTAFQVIGVDYAGPLRYKTSKGKEGKSYVLLYACSFSRAIYLELLPNLEMSECLDSLQRFIARRGRPERIYSDNGATFVGASKWVRAIAREEKLQDYLARNGIKWQFNLSRAPWWGGQFERLIGLVKAALYKVIGHGQLRWKELQKVLISVEITLNDRPLAYLEEDTQCPVLTPNSLLFLRPSYLLEPPVYLLEDPDLRKRYKFLLRCKEAMWNRWTKEYLRALRERHVVVNKKKGGSGTPQVGDVVIVKSEERNRGKWRLGVVEHLITGRDGVTRGAKLRTGKSVIERPVQFLYPLELSCDRTIPEPHQNLLDPEATEFRPKRKAAIAANRQIREIAELEQNS